MSSQARAGAAAADHRLVNVGALRDAYYDRQTGISDPARRVRMGRRGHCGSSRQGTFNEDQVLAITQAICNYRRAHRVTGPLYLGRDTHALSEPAFMTALEVLVANRIECVIDASDRPTPTPALSHAIVTCNRQRAAGLADGIVITASQDPPEDGGLKYNPPHGGPAGMDDCRWIEDQANALLARNLTSVARIPYRRARSVATLRRYDYVGAYVSELSSVVDLDVIRLSKLRIGVDPMGGSSLAIWHRISERCELDVELVNDASDPTFSFVPLDWDGRIRMDCSSRHAMATLVDQKARFDIAVGNDPDAVRHGIVTRRGGLMHPNRYLALAALYLFTHRPDWRAATAIGKTVATSSLIDRAAARAGRAVVEVPVGFTWLAPGLLDGALGFAADETGGASFLRRDGTVWTTDQDGIVAGLLAAEIMARMGRDPADLYADLMGESGASAYERIDVAATEEEKTRLRMLSPADIRVLDLAGDPIETRLTKAPGNGVLIGGVKVITPHGWFVARPCGARPGYGLYAESFRGPDHLHRIQEEAQTMIAHALRGRSR
jgi:phosphoglucomutase